MPGTSVCAVAVLWKPGTRRGLPGFNVDSKQHRHRAELCIPQSLLIWILLRLRVFFCKPEQSVDAIDLFTWPSAARIYSSRHKVQHISPLCSGHMSTECYSWMSQARLHVLWDPRLPLEHLTQWNAGCCFVTTHRYSPCSVWLQQCHSFQLLWLISEIFRISCRC